MKFLLSLLFLAFLFSTQMVNPVAGQASEYQALHGLGDVRFHQVESEALDQSYKVLVRLPANYDEAKDYPALYLLDGGITFPLLGSYYHYLSFAKELPEMIIIGLSYGTDGSENTRSRDYTAPSSERAHWGGAEAFQDLLSDEIIPLVENNYSIDENRRLIFGQSLGGQFVLFTAQTRPDLFWGHIASNPALHRNLDFFLAETANGGKNVRPRLFVSSGEFDDARFRDPAMKWMEHWGNSEGNPWELEMRTLDSQSHMSAAPEAFRQGVRWIFEME